MGKRSLWDMCRLGLGRIAQALAVTLVVSAGSFVLVDAAPGSFFDDLRLDPRIDPATIERLRVQYGLDRPLASRYLQWLRSALSGELGYSLTHGVPVSVLLWERVARTLLLTAAAALLAWIVALPAGIAAAAWHRSPFDRLIGLGSACGLALPDLTLALLALWIALEVGWLAPGGLALPAIVLAAGMAPALVRHVRSTMIETLGMRFVTAARARGVPEARLLTGGVLKAAANPLTTLAGLSLATLMSASLAVEVVLSWPGLGPLMLEATLARDAHLVAATATVSTVIILIGTLAADLALVVVDPRLQPEESAR